MTDVELLRDRIDNSGYKMSYLAKQLGLTPQGFYLKVNGTNEFKATEIQKLCELLCITEPEEMKRIFFASSVEEKSTAKE